MNDERSIARVIPPEIVEAAVTAYDIARCRLQGVNYADHSMSDANRFSIKPLIVAAIQEAVTLLEPDTQDPPLVFAYVNYRGEAGHRRVSVLGLRWGSTKWHPEPQWLLRAVDLEKGQEREFAVKDMRPVAVRELQVGPVEAL